jgi:hypothetical protein
MADAPEPIIGPVRIRDKSTGHEYTVGIVGADDLDKVDVLEDVSPFTTDGSRWAPPVHAEPKPAKASKEGSK